MMARKQKVLQRMETEKFDQLVFYADKEHGSNFEYLTGFIPRFEEGLLVLNKDGMATLILGNENLKLCQHARISADLIHYPAFSLPNQPMDGEQKLSQILKRFSMKLLKNRYRWLENVYDTTARTRYYV